MNSINPTHWILIWDNFGLRKLGGLIQIERLICEIKNTDKNAQIFLFAKQNKFAEIKWSKSTTPNQIKFLSPKNITTVNLADSSFVIPTQLVSARGTFKDLVQRKFFFELKPHQKQELNEENFYKKINSFYENKNRQKKIWFLNQSRQKKIEKQLLLSLIKPTDGYAARFINRHISLRITRVLALTNIKPSWVSWWMLPIVFSFSFLLFLGKPLYLFWGSFVYNLASILDGCDGELARLKYEESTHGAKLDTFLDQLTNLCYVFFLGVGLYRLENKPFYFYEGLFTTLLMASLFLTLYSRQNKNGGLSHVGREQIGQSNLNDSLKKILHVFATLLRRDSYIYILVVLSFFELNHLILHFLTLGTIGHIGTIRPKK